MNSITQKSLGAVASAVFIYSSFTFAQPAPPPVAFVQASNVACKVGRANVKPGETVTWQGQCADGLAQGPGIAQWSEGGKPTLGFQGIFAKGLLEGKGKMIGADGDRYDGEYKGGLRHGHGIYVSANGARFEGEYVNNQRGTAGTPPPAAATPAPAPQAVQTPAPAAPTPSPIAAETTKAGMMVDKNAGAGPAISTGDILGISIGMRATEVRAALAKANPKFKLNEHQDGGWQALVIDASQIDFPGQQTGFKDIVVVKFTETDQKVWYVGRSVALPVGQQPLTQTVEKDILAKFGKPSAHDLQQQWEFYSWAYGPDGRLDPKLDWDCQGRTAIAEERHAFGGPTIYLHPLNPACLRYIQAAIFRPYGQPEIVEGVSMSITDIKLPLSDPRHPSNVAAEAQKRQVEEAQKNRPRF